MEHKDGGLTVGNFVVLMSVYLGLNSSLNILNKVWRGLWIGGRRVHVRGVFQD